MNDKQKELVAKFMACFGCSYDDAKRNVMGISYLLLSIDKKINPERFAQLMDGLNNPGVKLDDTAQR